MEQFSNSDIDILMEALDSWEVKDNATDLMSGLLGAMLLEKGSEAEAKWKKEEEERKSLAVREKQERKERSVLLKAKLISLRSSAIANDVAESFAR